MIQDILVVALHILIFDSFFRSKYPLNGLKVIDCTLYYETICIINNLNDIGFINYIFRTLTSQMDAWLTSKVPGLLILHLYLNFFYVLMFICSFTS